MENLDPQLLARLLRGEKFDNYTLGRGNYTGMVNPNEDGTGDPRNFEQVIYDQGGKDGWTSNNWNTWNTDGTYRGSGTGDSDALSAAKFIAMALGSYYGGSALAGGAESGAVSGMDLMADNPAWWSQVGDIGTTAGGAGLSSADKAAMYGNDGYGGSMTGGETGAYDTALKSATPASNFVDAAKTAASGLNTGGLLGAAAGALSSKDQQKTSSVEPWAPAQPMLKGLIDQLPALQQQYAQQPFNNAQKAGYNNMAGLLDLVNKNAGGLLSGFQANASGANQFQRGNPRGLIGSSFNPSPAEWQPQSFGRFGG